MTHHSVVKPVPNKSGESTKYYQSKKTAGSCLRLTTGLFPSLAIHLEGHSSCHFQSSMFISRNRLPRNNAQRGFRLKFPSETNKPFLTNALHLSLSSGCTTFHRHIELCESLWQIAKQHLCSRSFRNEALMSGRTFNDVVSFGILTTLNTPCALFNLTLPWGRCSFYYMF